MEDKDRKLLLEIAKIHIDRNNERGIDNFVPIDFTSKEHELARRSAIVKYFTPASEIKVGKYGQVINDKAV